LLKVSAPVVSSFEPRIFRNLHSIRGFQEREPEFFRYRAMNCQGQIIPRYECERVTVLDSGDAIGNRAGAQITGSDFADERQGCLQQ
jgi:hypothetical protein